MLQTVSLDQVVVDAAKEVFGTMIFMDIEQCESLPQPIEGKALISAISFKGSMEGCLAIHLPESCAKTIAANMLGLDSAEALSISEICDAVGEVANMTMGSIKTRLQATINDIQVSIPTVITGQEMNSNSGDNFSRISCYAMLDAQYPIVFNLLYRQPK